MNDLALMRSGLLRSGAIFNTLGDKIAARSAWKARFENRAPPKSPRQAKVVQVRAAAGLADTTDILLYDEIGAWGVSAKEFITALATITTPNICVRINSPGGDVFDGMAIYNALKTSPKNITCVVDGLAASAASYIAMAGKTVSMHESAMMMIHRAWGFAIGNAGDMADMVKVLNKIDGEIAAIYAKQSGKTADEMLALMAGESDGTWFTSEEAAAASLVDEIVQPTDKTDDNPVADDSDTCCDPDSPDYDPDDPDCECSDQAKAAAKEKFKAKSLIATMRQRLALSEAD